MATRKKKTEEQTIAEVSKLIADATLQETDTPKKKTKKKVDVIMSADIAEMTDRSGVVKGNHLTVTTFSDGTTKLEWDEDALLAEVRNALLKAESVLPVTETKPKRKTKEKQNVK
jgi:hypothetical protein